MLRRVINYIKKRFGGGESLQIESSKERKTKRNFFLAFFSIIFSLPKKLFSRVKFPKIKIPIPIKKVTGFLGKAFKGTKEALSPIPGRDLTEDVFEERVTKRDSKVIVASAVPSKFIYRPVSKRERYEPKHNRKNIAVSNRGVFSESVLEGRKLGASNIVKVYGERTVVNRVSYYVRQGEVVGLLGPNGAGKTTSFYITVGFIKASGGSVELDNEPISHLPMYQRARRGIGYLPQESSIFRKLTVEQNLMAILEYINIPKKIRKEKMERLLEELDITHVRDQKAFTLSGGERRRAEIARALTTEPDFLLLDEPFAGVDPIAVYDIQSIIAKLKERNLGILITDHNVRETLRITDRAYIMNEGNILVQGNAEKIINDPTARKVYLGEKFSM